VKSFIQINVNLIELRLLQVH